MRYGTTAGFGLAVTLTVASWLVFPGAAAAPTSTPSGVESTVTSSPPIATAARADVATDGPVRVTTTTVAPTLAEETRHALNDLRHAAGLDPLVADDELDALAQAWAARIAVDARLHHSSLIYDVVEDDAWTAAGENVGYGPSVAVLIDAFVASPSHEANIVSPRYRAIGIGIVVVDDVIWTAHLFAG
ncbi:MAG: CAP domain-containing protein [Acidimicrobiales bacterium]|nr:CAP domain-containing protein [Acidimicrobiales bacterium]